MCKKIKFKKVPKVSTEEFNVFSKVISLFNTREKNLSQTLTTFEMQILGAAMAKIHLKRMVLFATRSKYKKFILSCARNNLQLYNVSKKESERNLLLTLENYGLFENTMYRLGYIEVLKKYFKKPFNVRIVENTSGIFILPYTFKV